MLVVNFITMDDHFILVNGFTDQMGCQQKHGEMNYTIDPEPVVLWPDFINLSQFNRHTLSAANTAIGIVQDWLLIQPSLFEKESVALAHFECQHWDENPWMFDLNLQNSKFPFNRLSTWISSPAFSLKRFHIFNHVLGPPKTTWICIIFLSYVVLEYVKAPAA